MQKRYLVGLFFLVLHSSLTAEETSTQPIIEFGRASCIPLPPQEDDICRDRAIWEHPVCPAPTGLPLSYPEPEIDGTNIRIQLYGYVKGEAFWHTRQVQGFREQQVLLFPLPRRLDDYGIDINEHGMMHMTAIETRVGMALHGPIWNGVKVDGLIEGDFRGPIEAGNSSFRLRHAFGRFKWDTGFFLFGQWWHPLFILKCFPHTVTFGIGTPMEPQARDPQFRITQRWNWFEVIFALLSQRSFASNGPRGISTEYIRNSVTPNIHLQTRAYFGPDREHLIGVAADYKRLVPRIESDKGFSVKETIGSIIFEGFASFLKPPWSLRMKAYWAQNANDQLLISGFGVHTINPETDERTYTNTRTAGAWLDFTYIFGCDDKELGFFVGGTKNLGAGERLFIDPETGEPIIYALTDLGPNLDYVVRFSPRFVYKRDPIRVGVELEYSRASFGTPDAWGRVRNGVPVDNYRILLAVYYMF